MWQLNLLQLPIPIRPFTIEAGFKKNAPLVEDCRCEEKIRHDSAGFQTQSRNEAETLKRPNKVVSRIALSYVNPFPANHPVWSNIAAG